MICSLQFTILFLTNSTKIGISCFTDLLSKLDYRAIQDLIEIHPRPSDNIRIPTKEKLKFLEHDLRVKY